MAQSLIACPLCSAASFSNTSALCLSLVNVASKWLRCTMCEEELRGLDKLTVHLLGHLIQTPSFKKALATNNSTISNESSDTRLFLNSQPLNLVKNQNEQANLGLIHKNPCDVMDQHCIQMDGGTERPSLKVDDEVMIFFNCDKLNVNLENKKNEVSVVRALDEETPSSSGLPKFSINFEKTVSGQNENVLCSEKKNLLSNENYIDKNSKNDTFQQIFSSCPESLNENAMVAVNDREVQMEFCYIDKDKEINNSLPFIENKSDVGNETGFSMGHTESPIGNKSSFLSPKGERVMGFRCDVCSLVFPDEQILSMHRQLIHIELHSGLTEPTGYKCHLCSKSFVMKGSLMVHMRVAHFGGAVVSRLVEAKQLETDAVSPGSANFICSICNKGFQKEQQLAQHEKLHDGKQCDICFKTFTTKYFLRKHKRLHTGEMPYQCSQCNKSFTFQQSYHKHLLYHSDEKPYSCGDCGRAFKELSTLHNHQRIHTGEKPYSCETCGKCFRQRVSYLVHRRIHTGAMPYRCQDCGKTFRYKVSERTHKCSTSTSTGSNDAANPPPAEAKQKIPSSFGPKEKEDAISKEVEPEPMQDLDFFSLVMSPSDKLQHLSLASDSADDSGPQTQRESIDSETLKELLYDVADYT